MERLLFDLHVALRSLRRSPGFVTVASAILGIGIGMSAAMFTVFKTIFVDRLPIADQDRVVIMHPLDRSGKHLDVPESYLSEITRDSALVRSVAGASHLTYTLPFMDGDEAISLTLDGVSANYFDVLGMRPVLGRLLRAEDEQAGAPLVLVLSYAAWRRKFGGDASVVGRSLVWPPNIPVRIVGVAPPGFDYPAGTDVWRAIPPAASSEQVDIVARLASGATIASARQGLFALTQRINPFANIATSAGQPESWKIAGVTAQSSADTVLGASRPPIVALSIAVGVLLLITCINIGNLSLVRLLGRTREIAVRRAIGARSTDVVRLLAIENAIIGTLGGALGLLLALAALQLVRVFAPPQLPRIDVLGSLGAPIAAAVGISLFALLLFGALPSAVAARIRAYAVLRNDTRSGVETRPGQRARRWLVAIQIALAIVMLNGAGLLVRTLAQLESVDLGYRPDHLSILAFTASAGATVVLPPGVTFGDVGKELVARLEATPGVAAATPILSEPFIGQTFYISKLARPEQPVLEQEQNPFTPYEFGGSDYFRTLAIPILLGRGFRPSDTRSSEQVVVVNEKLAKQFWPNENPLGKRLLSVAGATGNKTYTVVGVARDTHFRELRNGGPVAYFPWEQVGNFFPSLVAVRTNRPLAEILPALRAASRDVNQRLVIWKAETVDQLLDAPLAQPRISAVLLASFGVVALLLAALGVYGVISSTVRQQTRNIGVRLALGATAGDVYRLVLREAAWVLGIGGVAGLVVASLGGRLLIAQLFQVRPLDPVSLGGAAALLVGIGLAAASLPARRATRVDPVSALRTD